MDTIAIDAKPLPARPDPELYERRAADLLEANPEAGWTLADTQLAIAREHGFAGWPAFVEHLVGLDDGPIQRYEAAADAIVDGDVPALAALLRDDPELVRRRSTRVHGATLLHYVAANGVEQYRQKSPPNAVEIADLLLRNGADPNATATMYGEADTTMELLVSSSHPADAGVQVPLVHKLADFGAALDGPLLTAVVFQYANAAEALVERGANVDTVVTAAGLGREDLVREMVDDHGRLEPGVRLVSVGHPEPSRDPRANLEWALTCAAALGHAAVVGYLLDCGVDADAKGFAGRTAVQLAADWGHQAVVDQLARAGHEPPR